MKRPERIVLHEVVLSKPDHIWVDYNGQPKRQYYIEIPYWIGRAYRLDHKHVKVVIGDAPNIKERRNDRKTIWEYFKANWSKKVTKMRRMNHGYVLVSKVKESIGRFASVGDYEAYHEELAELNKKYMKSIETPETDAPPSSPTAKRSEGHKGVSESD